MAFSISIDKIDIGNHKIEGICIEPISETAGKFGLFEA
jgi:hypothetical protein